MWCLSPYRHQISCVWGLTSLKPPRIFSSVTSRPWGISGGHAPGPLASQTNKLNDPLHVAPNQRFKSSGNGDDLRRLLLEMAKNAADLAHATRKNGNHKNGNAKPGLRFGRYFTAAGSHAYDLIEWERRTAAIMGEKG